MSVASGTLALLVTAVCLAVPAATRGQGAPPMPTPGPEHQVLEEDEGVWDASVEIFPGPGAAPLTSKGVETNTIGCGGLCLITDFKGEMMPGQLFHGHGTTTYDPARKKYVGSWTDSMSRGLMIGESTYDPATRTATGVMEGPDPSGKVSKAKSVVQYKGGTRVFTLHMTGPDGKEVPSMRITYTRRQ